MSAEAFSKGPNVPRPANVERARLTNDTAALSALGRAGAKKRFENIEGARLSAEHDALKRAEEEDARFKQSGENIIPADPIN